jgi:uncharacterized glyoxalase superfamily protein PhnB
MNPPAGYPRVSPYLIYADAEAAIEHLTSAFGFAVRRRETGAAGRLHAELVIEGDGLVMLGQGGDGFTGQRSMVHVYVSAVDALHTRATNAGADVTELEESPAGDRRFTAQDPEGQLWVFAQRVR